MNRKERRKKELELRRLKKKQTVVDLTRVEFPEAFLGNSQVDKCYAACLGNCRGSISREHYISDSILQQFEKIDANGIPWLRDMEGTIAPASIVSKVLCEGHNSYLSPLDDFAGKFFKEVVLWSQDLPRKTTVSGHIFERWMLKVLLGLVATGKLKNGVHGYSRGDIAAEWVNVLFGLDSFSEGAGLFVNYSAGTKITFQPKLSVAPLYLDNAIAGLHLHLAGLEFYLSFVPKEIGFTEDVVRQNSLLYRFGGINKNPYPQSIEIIW